MRNRIRLIVQVAIFAVVGLASAGFWSASAAAAPEVETLVFLLAGQSNMVGKGKKIPEEYKAPLENVLFFENGTFRNLGCKMKEDTAAEAAKVDGKGVSRYADPDHFGPEVSFAREIGKAFPGKTILLVKHSKGGTSLAGPWNPAARGNLYDGLLAQYRAATKDRKCRLAAILWAQGGADASQQKDADAYAKNFKAFIEKIRHDLDAPELPFIFSGTRQEDLATNAKTKRSPHFLKILEAKLETEKNVPETKIVSTAGLSRGSDGVHYDEPGLIEFGKRFAKAYLEMAK